MASVSFQIHMNGH